MKIRNVAMALALGFTTVGASNPGPPPRIPVEDFAQLPFISNPVLSPDGLRIAATVSGGGVERVAVYDLAAGASKPPVLVSIGDKAALRSLRWAGTDRLLIAVLTTGQFLGFTLPMTRLLSYELSTRKVSVVGKSKGLFADDVIFIDPEGRYLLLSSQRAISETPAVERISFLDGSSTLVQPSKPGVWSWFADEEGTVRAGVDYDDRRLKLFYRSAAGAELKRLETIKIAPAEDSVIDAINFVPSTDQVYVLSNAATGRFGVYRYDFASDGIGEPVFEHPKVDVAAITMNGTAVESILYEDDRPRVKWFSPDMATIQQSIDRTLKGKDNRIVGKSRDGNVVLIWSGAANDPGTYYVYDRRAARMNAFAAPYDALLGAHFAPVEPVEYRARDGLTIPAYLTLPAGRPAKALPLIVMPHGGPFIRTSWTFDPWVQFLANRGYAVLQPNFRGSTGYGREFVARGFGQWGTGMATDMDDGVDWLVARGTVDSKRVCLLGASYGGYAALWGAIRAPERYRCAISFAGVTDVRAMLRYDGKAMSASRYFRQWRKRVEGEEKTDLSAISPLQQAKRLKVPVLIAHGEKDNNVPVDQSTKLVKALKGSPAPVESLFYKEAGHNFTKSEDSADFLKKVEAFLAKYNPS